ncbi:2230_t:CDS:2, partial [Ambispora gerdemannii]
KQRRNSNQLDSRGKLIPIPQTPILRCRNSGSTRQLDYLDSTTSLLLHKEVSSSVKKSEHQMLHSDLKKPIVPGGELGILVEEIYTFRNRNGIVNHCKHGWCNAYCNEVLPEIRLKRIHLTNYTPDKGALPRKWMDALPRRQGFKLNFKVQWSMAQYWAKSSRVQLTTLGRVALPRRHTTMKVATTKVKRWMHYRE